MPIVKLDADQVAAMTAGGKLDNKFQTIANEDDVDLVFKNEGSDEDLSSDDEEDSM